MDTDLVYGGDLVIDTLRRSGIEYVAMNPGASYRGLHESLVAAGNPVLILALQENVAVAIGEGYARVAGKPMAVFLHNVVGLLGGSMAIFNAWADQVPVLIVGGSGPADAAQRRPWIDWAHSARSQALVARNFMKWDDEPASLAATQESLVRALRIATTVPQGPCYVSIDALLQEAPLDAELLARQKSLPAPALPSTLTVPLDVLKDVAARLAAAQNPVVLADSVGRSEVAYDALIRLAETLAMPVVDLGARLNFPTDHWADGTAFRAELLREADLVLALDLRDVALGTGRADPHTREYTSFLRPDAAVVAIGTNQLMHRGFMDYGSYTGRAEELLGDTAAVLPVLADLADEHAARRAELTAARRRRLEELRATTVVAKSPGADGTDMAVTKRDVAAAVFAAVDGTGPWQVANGHLGGLVRQEWALTQFNAHLGRNIGGGLGYGVGLAIGAALAHRGDDTLIVNLQNDGDLMYAPSALWTAAKYRLPILTVVVNNQRYGQDYMHQSVVAAARSRPIEHASVGIDIKDPDIDFAELARSQGMHGIGPVLRRDQLVEHLSEAVRLVRRERRPVLVDVRIG